MLKRLIFAFSVLVSLIAGTLSGSPSAQEPRSWEAVFIVHDGSGLYVVTPNQVEYISLPEEFAAYSSAATVSLDGRYVLYPSSSRELPRLGDLSTLTCCTPIHPPAAMEQILEFRPGV